MAYWYLYQLLINTNKHYPQCRTHADHIASRLGFGAIEYAAGPYFKRRVRGAAAGLQIDLLFKRSDRVWTVCEIKYQNEPIGREIISEMAKKLALLAVPPKVSIQKVLITASDPSESLLREPYFDQVLRLEDFQAASG